MSRTVDHALKQFESKFLREFSALTQFSQSTALRIARDYAEDILILYNDGYSTLETARYICQLVDVDELKKNQYQLSASASWR